MTSRLASKCSRESGTRNGGGFRHWVVAAPVVCSLFLFAGCSEQPQDLEERTTQLQKELDRTQSDLKTANQAREAAKAELARLKSSAANTKRETAAPSPAEHTFPSRETLEASYIAAAKTLKKQMQERMKEFTLGNFTLHNVQLPDNQYPITSWISLGFQAGDGQQYRLDFPVKADLDGKWIFPDPDEIGRRVADAKKVAATSNSSQTQSPARPKESPSSNAPNTVPSDTTVVIQWPGSSPNPQAPTNPNTESTSVNPQPSPPQNPNPKTSPPQNPKQNIPADRDVLIRF